MEPDYPHSITQHPHPHIHRMSGSAGSAAAAAAAAAASVPAVIVEPASPFHSPSPTHPASATLSPAVLSPDHASSTGVEAHHRAGDLESQTGSSAAAGSARTRSPAAASGSDPYGLASAYKTDRDLELIRTRPNTSRKRHHPRDPDPAAPPSTLPSLPSPLSAGSRRARRVEGFYRSQNAAIERMLKSVDDHRAEARQEQGDDVLRLRLAVWGSLVANVVLSGLQLYAAVSSGSLSLFTTMADSIFDPLSNVMLIVSNRAIRRVDPRRFPAGKARLETCGNIVFCFLMSAVSLVIVAFSARDLTEGHAEATKDFRLPSVLSVCAAFATKLALFFFCWTLKDRYSQVRILWQDHRNDLLINGMGILTSVAGSKLRWWVDPAGAILLSVVITVIWMRTAFSEFTLLVGVAAPVETVQLITYTCLTHSPAILGIDTVRVYHSGPRLIAEVDIVMDRYCTLFESHDVAEELQMKLESLPDVERSFVHVDYETSHSPEHSWRKDL